MTYQVTVSRASYLCSSSSCSLHSDGVCCWEPTGGHAWPPSNHQNSKSTSEVAKHVHLHTHGNKKNTNCIPEKPPPTLAFTFKDHEAKTSTENQSEQEIEHGRAVIYSGTHLQWDARLPAGTPSPCSSPHGSPHPPAPGCQCWPADPLHHPESQQGPLRGKTAAVYPTAAPSARSPPPGSTWLR